MTRRHTNALLSAGAVLVVLGVSPWVLRGAEFGDVDPISAGLGFVSLLVGVVSLIVAIQAWRWQQAACDQVAERLAAAVREKEQQARQQLLGGHDDPIDVQFVFRPALGHNAEHASRKGRLSE